MIEVLELQKRFGALKAVANVSFAAPDGSITGLLGANGAGKTTTLRNILGVMRQDSGSAKIDAHAQNGWTAQSHIGALLDHTGLYSRLTARENLVYFGQLHGLSGISIRKRTGEVLAALGLEAVADRRAGELSEGQRMKVALGRAIIHSPRNLLLDEPTNGLDIPTVRSLRSLLRRMRDSGLCIVFSSHVLEEIQAVCDRLVILAHGCVVACGSPEEICRETATNSLEDAFLTVTSRFDKKYA